jgi:hypothetical protein
MCCSTVLTCPSNSLCSSTIRLAWDRNSAGLVACIPSYKNKYIYLIWSLYRWIFSRFSQSIHNVSQKCDIIDILYPKNQWILLIFIIACWLEIYPCFPYLDYSIKCTLAQNHSFATSTYKMIKIDIFFNEQWWKLVKSIDFWDTKYQLYHIFVTHCEYSVRTY